MRLPAPALAAAIGLAALAPAAHAQSIFAPRGIDDEVRRIAASDEPVAFVARCVVSLTRAAQASETPEARRKEETRAWTLVRELPAVAMRTGVQPGRAAAVLALATLPLATSSISLSPPGAPASSAGDVDGCRKAADDPAGYVAGLKGTDPVR